MRTHRVARPRRSEGHILRFLREWLRAALRTHDQQRPRQRELFTRRQALPTSGIVPHSLEDFFEGVNGTTALAGTSEARAFTNFEQFC